MQQKVSIFMEWSLLKLCLFLALSLGYKSHILTAAFANTFSKHGRLGHVAFRPLKLNINIIQRGGSVNDSPTHASETALSSSSISDVTEKSCVEDADNQGSSTTSSSSSTLILADDKEFIKSGPDKRLYRAIKLKNGLEALIVSDPNTDVEAGAVHVKAGHFNDPDDRAGLAHFHEHMLFLGTEKYPDENDFETYLSTNGGSTNAYTAMEDTNYYFSVAPLDRDEDEDVDEELMNEIDIVAEEEEVDLSKTSGALTGALDRFSQFFIAPRFRVEAADRELRAINSEYINGIPSDSWRNYQLLKSSCNPAHPFAKFGCGNYNTLTNGGNIEGTSAEESGGSSPRPVLLKFWDQYYHAGNIKLAVVGKAPLDALQKTVESTFGGVRSGSSIKTDEAEIEPVPTTKKSIFETENKGGVPAFSPEYLGVIKEVIPVIETRQIKILFATPPIDDPLMESSKPQRVISHLLGHESPGSLHSVLNEEGLINALNTGTGVDTSDFSLFSLSVSLTVTGMKQRDRVLQLIFQWIDLIKSSVHDSDVMEQYHDELRQISKNGFMFRENGDPTGFASNAAENLFFYEPSKILSAPSTTGEYNAEVTKAYVERFRPENALITILDPDLGKENTENNGDNEVPRTSAQSAPWKTEKWYKAQYRQIAIPETIMKEWEFPAETDPRLKLPKLNEFIPSDFSLRCDDTNEQASTEESGPPRLLINQPDLRLWHKMDRTYRVPKTVIRFHITSPNTYRSPRTMTLCRLFQKVLNDDLNSYVYDSGLAGCSYRVDCMPNGYRVTLSGYSEKLPILIEDVTARMLSIIDEMKEGEAARPGLARKFKKAQQNLLRQTKNYRLDSPYEVANYNSRILMEEKAWHVDSYIAEMEGEYAERNPLTLEECAQTAAESLMGRIKTELLCMGNINEKEAKDVVNIIKTRFLDRSRPLAEDEVPVFRSMKLPTKDEASIILGTDMSSTPIPLVYEEVAFSESEENNAVEILMQTDNEQTLGLEGVAVLELIGYMAYNSAFSQLRTKEQLGYITSAFTRQTAGGVRCLGVLVQSSSTLPPKLEERCEAWIEQYRKEIEEMSEDRIANEAGAVVAQLLEKDTKLSEEVSRYWSEISGTDEMYGKLKEPNFDRIQDVVGELILAENEEDKSKVASRKTAAQMKQKMLELYDKYFLKSSPHRRALSARVYAYKEKSEMEKNIGKSGYISTHAEVRSLKQYLSTWPTAPYWSKKF